MDNIFKDDDYKVDCLNQENRNKLIETLNKLNYKRDGVEEFDERYFYIFYKPKEYVSLSNNENNYNFFNTHSSYYKTLHITDILSFYNMVDLTIHDKLRIALENLEK